MPERTEGWRFLLLRGEAETLVDIRVADGAAGPAGLDLRRGGRAAAVQQITGELATCIGPYAEYAVARVTRTSADLDDLYRQVAQEIPNEPARVAFLGTLQPGGSAAFGPGLWFSARRDAAGALLCDRRLQARDEVLMLAALPDLTPGLEH